MGRFDDLTADLKPSAAKGAGRFDDLVTDLQSSSGASSNSQEPNWGQIAQNALKEATLGTVSKLRDLLTNPVTQLKVLPYLMGPAMSLAGVPGGMTLGTVGGRQFSNAGLKILGHPEEIPPVMETSSHFPYLKGQIPEAALSAVGDLTAVPSINRKFWGSEIGTAEKAAGVPPPQDIPPLSRPAGPQPVSNAVRDAIDLVKNPEIQKTPVFWKQLKDQVKWIYDRGKNEVMSDLDKGSLRWLNQQAQEGLNATIPGRAGPAAALARSQTIPNAISKVSGSIPWWAKAAGTVVGGDALARMIGHIGLGSGR